MTKSTVGALAASTAIMLAAASPAFAQTVSVGVGANAAANVGVGRWGGVHRAMPGVFGTVTAINGSTITLQGRSDQDADTSGAASPATYTVDASNAAVTKAGTGSSLSSIAVGDNLMVQGTVNGSSVTATAIHDGVQGRGPREWGSAQGSAMTSIHGNGQPIVAGSVSAVNGSTLTVTTSAGPSYTIDASGATVTKQGATSTVADVSVGDRVVVQGGVQGSNVTASTVLDQGATVSANAAASAGANVGFMGRVRGFFGGLLQLFGF